MTSRAPVSALPREESIAGIERPFRFGARPSACVAGAALLVFAFHAAAGWFDHYLIRYGRFEPSVGELAFKRNLLLLVLPAMALAAIAVAEFAPRAARIFDALGAARRGRWWPIGLAVLALALAMLAREGVLESMPITDDEQSYAFQALLLGSGRLYAESLPQAVRPFVDNEFIINNGRWFSFYFVGQPAVLAFASFVGLRNWVAPILAAVTLLLGVGIARRVGGERVAIVAAILTVTSPFFVLVSATELSEPTSACCMATVLYAALRLEEEPHRARWWVVAAMAVSVGMLVRPQSAVIFPVPVAIRLGFLWSRARLRSGWLGPAAAVAILFLGATVVFGINYTLTGTVWRTSQMAYYDQGRQWTFAWGLVPSLNQIATSVAQLQFWLFGWPVSLAFLPFFRPDGRTWMLSAVVGSVVLWYGFFAVPMVMTVGPVYYTELIVPLAVLSASGFERSVLRLRQRFGDDARTRAVVVAPLVGLIAALVAFVPVELASLRRMTRVTRAPYELVEAEGLTNALVFVGRLPNGSVPPGSWVLSHRNNAPDLSDSVLYVQDLGERNRTLMAYLPNRIPYRLGMRGSRLVLTRADRPVDR